MTDAGKTVLVSTHKRRAPGQGGRPPGAAGERGDHAVTSSSLKIPPSFQALLSASRLISIDISYGEGVVVTASGDTRVIDVCLEPTVLRRLWLHGPRHITRQNGTCIPLFTAHWSGAHDEALPKSAQVKDILLEAWHGGWRGPGIRWVLRPAWRGGRAENGENKMALYQAYANQHGYSAGWQPGDPPPMLTVTDTDSDGGGVLGEGLFDQEGPGQDGRGNSGLRLGSKRMRAAQRLRSPLAHSIGGNTTGDVDGSSSDELE